MRSKHIALIGAGLVGSLLAVFLSRRGNQVTVYERRPDLRRSAISAGRSINLALANRGMVALERAGILKDLRPLLLPMAGRMIHDEHGQTTFLSYGHRPEEVIYSVSRGGLNQKLLDLAEAEGATIYFEQNCLDVDFADKKLKILNQATRRESLIDFEVVLGTDGSASHVRDAILQATGGKCLEEQLGHGYKELTIAAGADGGFQMDQRSLHIWPRGEFMLIALPNPDASFTLTLFLPQTGPESFASLNDTKLLEGFFQKYFSDALQLMPDLSEQFFGNPLGSLGTIWCDIWHYRGQVLLLGDAAHAIVPFHGQGMNCGFEDVVAFDHLLNDDAMSWETLFERFSAERKPNADAIATMALENYVEMRSTVRDPRFALKKTLSFALEDRFGPRFIPRYSMVMFHTMPYAKAQQRGVIQEEILNELTAGINSLEEVDFDYAARLIEQKL